MLPPELKRTDQNYDGNGIWFTYLNEIGDKYNRIDHDFLSQICLEHFDRFN